jgi:diguanylate cyclase (GGDEF)-like protein
MKKSINLIEYFEKKPKTFLILLSILLLVLVWFIDYSLGWEINFAPGYLLPIVFVTWLIGRKAGIAIAICSGFLRFVTIIWEGHFQPSLVFHIYNVGIRLIFFLFISYLISELKTSLEREKYFGRVDYLTGLANKRQFDELSNIEIQRSLRYKHKFTVAYIDIDYFKAINDRFGHHVGNILLTTVAKTIKKNIRTIDVAARIGGDEFTILMPETGRESAEVVINRLQKDLLDIMQKRKWPVAFSFGVVTADRSPDSINEILKIADKLMYFSKSKGTSKVSYEAYNK